MNKAFLKTVNNHPSASRASLFLFSLLIAAFFAATFPLWKALIGTWSSSDEYSHGFFIIPLSCYIGWRKKDTLLDIPAKPSNLGLAFTILSLLLYLFAHLAEISTVRSFSVILIITGTLFMIPVPAQIYAKLTIPLQLFVSKSSTWLAAVFGLPIYREGNVIHLADQTFQVVRACSGLRSMISLLTLSAVFGYFTLRSNFLRSILFVAAIPAAIFVNIIRVLLMALAYHFFTYDLTTGTIHKVFGLVIFLLALAFLVGVRALLTLWDSS